MGSGGGGSDTNTIRYAPYIEGYHASFLAVSSAAGTTARATNPFDSYTDLEVDDAFLGSGYTISSFPSLYDMYGKFVAGLDVEVLWENSMSATQDSATINTLTGAHSSLLDDEIEETSLPRFQLGMRDINAVMSSSFLVGKSLIESAKVKKVAEFDADLRYKLIPVAEHRWATHLEWNRNVISSYMGVMQLYYNTVLAVDEHNYSMAAKEILWPFTVLDYERANLGALQGAMSSGKTAGASTAQKAIGGALSGAAMGATVGSAVPGIGTVAGAVVGGVLGLASGLL